VTSVATRPLRAFLLAPLVGAAVLWLLLVTLGIPRGVQQAPIFFLLAYVLPLFVVPMYGLVLVVGLIGSTVLSRMNRLDVGPLALFFGAAGLLLPAVLFTLSRQWTHSLAVPWVMMCGVVGLATGAAFGWLLLPPSE
jgi:hypothetical protein